MCSDTGVPHLTFQLRLNMNNAVLISFTTISSSIENATPKTVVKNLSPIFLLAERCNKSAGCARSYGQAERHTQERTGTDRWRQNLVSGYTTNFLPIEGETF